MTVVSLLRGINVGGHHRVGMDVLRDLCRSLGFTNPRTYIQSGNIVFETTARGDLARLSLRMEDALEAALGFRPAVISRSAQEWREIVARNPFHGRAGIDPAKLAVTFLATELAPEVRTQVLTLDVPPEELRCLDRELYIYFPNGFSRSRLSMPQLERLVKVPCTSRNWNTVLKLLDLTAPGSKP